MFKILVKHMPKCTTIKNGDAVIFIFVF